MRNRLRRLKAVFGAIVIAGTMVVSSTAQVGAVWTDSVYESSVIIDTLSQLTECRRATSVDIPRDDTFKTLASCNGTYDVVSNSTSFMGRYVDKATIKVDDLDVSIGFDFTLNKSTKTVEITDIYGVVSGINSDVNTLSTQLAGTLIIPNYITLDGTQFNEDNLIVSDIFDPAGLKSDTVYNTVVSNVALTPKASNKLKSDELEIKRFKVTSEAVKQINTNKYSTIAFDDKLTDIDFTPCYETDGKVDIRYINDIIITGTNPTYTTNKGMLIKKGPVASSITGSSSDSSTVVSTSSQDTLIWCPPKLLNTFELDSAGNQIPRYESSLMVNSNENYNVLNLDGFYDMTPYAFNNFDSTKVYEIVFGEKVKKVSYDVNKMAVPPKFVFCKANNLSNIDVTNTNTAGFLKVISDSFSSTNSDTKCTKVKVSANSDRINLGKGGFRGDYFFKYVEYSWIDNTGKLYSVLEDINVDLFVPKSSNALLSSNDVVPLSDTIENSSSLENKNIIINHKYFFTNTNTNEKVLPISSISGEFTEPGSTLAVGRFVKEINVLGTNVIKATVNPNNPYLYASEDGRFIYDKTTSKVVFEALYTMAPPIVKESKIIEDVTIGDTVGNIIVDYSKTLDDDGKTVIDITNMRYVTTNVVLDPDILESCLNVSSLWSDDECKAFLNSTLLDDEGYVIPDSNNTVYTKLLALAECDKIKAKQIATSVASMNTCEAHLNITPNMFIYMVTNGVTELNISESVSNITYYEDAYDYFKYIHVDSQNKYYRLKGNDVVEISTGETVLTMAEPETITTEEVIQTGWAVYPVPGYTITKNNVVYALAFDYDLIKAYSETGTAASMKKVLRFTDVHYRPVDVVSPLGSFKKLECVDIKGSEFVEVANTTWDVLVSKIMYDMNETNQLASCLQMTDQIEARLTDAKPIEIATTTIDQIGGPINEFDVIVLDGDHIDTTSSINNIESNVYTGKNESYILKKGSEVNKYEIATVLGQSNKTNFGETPLVFNTASMLSGCIDDIEYIGNESDKVNTVIFGNSVRYVPSRVLIKLAQTAYDNNKTLDIVFLSNKTRISGADSFIEFAKSNVGVVDDVCIHYLEDSPIYDQLADTACDFHEHQSVTHIANSLLKVTTLGDVNADSHIGLADTVALSKNSMSKSIYPLALQGEINGDVDKSGSIDAGDISRLIEFQLGTLEAL